MDEEDPFSSLSPRFPFLTVLALTLVEAGHVTKEDIEETKEEESG